MTLYPTSKCTPQRAVDIIETYGQERLVMNSACDWGPSDPLSVPQVRMEMARRGHDPKTVAAITLNNPGRFLGQCDKFRIETPPISKNP